MVKCENCGFLALRNRITGLLDEAPQEYRWRAEVPKLLPPLSDAYTGVPICLARAHPLHNEFTNQDQAAHREIFNLLEKERHCAERGLFTPWKQGFSPKEHQEMLNSENLMKWQAEREDKDRIWRERQAERDHKYRRSELRILVIALVAAIVIPIVAALIEGYLSMQTPSPEPIVIPTPNVTVQPPEVRLEPNIIINMPKQPNPDTPDAQTEAIP
jgi:hypothetical protein